MKTGIATLAVAAYGLLYALSLWHLDGTGAFPMEEAIGILVIVGIGFSFLSWITTLGIRPNVPLVTNPVSEALAALLLAAGIAAWLVYGKSWADGLIVDAAHGGSDFGHLAVGTLGKVVVFVIVPFIAFRVLFGSRLADFGLGREAWRCLFSRQGIAALVIGIAICAFQYFAGRGAEPIRDGTIAGPALWLGLPLAFLWLTIAVGLVEEFFFRGVLQSRLAAPFKSEIAGLFTMALIFGVMHAPGMVLRGGGDVEGLGMAPGWETAIAYTIVVQSVAAFFLGIFWLRTRNLPALMVIHAMADLLPNLPGFMKPFGLMP